MSYVDPAVDGTPAPGGTVKSAWGKDVQQDVEYLEAQSAAYASQVAAPTGVAATDVANIQAAHDALPSTGGEIRLQHGVYAIGSTPLSFTKAVKLTGHGGRLQGNGGAAVAAATVLSCSSGTTDAITASGPGSVFEDFALVCTAATPTAGTGINATFAGTVGSHIDLHRITILGFYNLVAISGDYYSVTDCYFLDAVNYGLYLSTANSGYYDHGDAFVANNLFTAYTTNRNVVAWVRWEEGGGLKFVGNKINGDTQPGNASAGSAQYGLWLHVSQSTSVLVVTGNSIEACTQACVKVDGVATMTFSKIAISGNEFMSAPNGTGVYCDGSSMGSLTNVAVTGNVFTGIYGLNLTWVVEATVTGNDFSALSLACVALTNVQKLSMAGNLMPSGGTSGQCIFDNDANSTTSTSGHARDVWEIRGDIIGLTTNADYGRIQPGQYSASVVTIEVFGNVSSVGAVCLQQTRQVTYTNTGAVTIGATIGTDQAFGPANLEVTITWDVTTNTGFLAPKVTSVNGKSVTGFVRMRFDGPAYEIYTP